MQTAQTAVILLAYGGPDSLDDIPAFLQDIRGGRHTPPRLVDEITERYRLIGGCSPLKEITFGAAAKLEAKLKVPVYVGMRHWHPYIRDTVAQMTADGVEHFVAVCMAPHFSALSIGKYRQQLEEAIAEKCLQADLSFVDSWHTQPDYLQGVADNVRKTLNRWAEAERESVTVIFTAHSLPDIVLAMGDPYHAQLQETAELLAEKLALADGRWHLCYQSASQTGHPWLGPPVEDLIVRLAANRQSNQLIAPIGFVADHVEILYDIDIAVQEIAREQGLRVERTPMLNDDQVLINALASLAQDALAAALI